METKKANRKQVCFSDKELEHFGEFIDSKGKFSTYVKRLIEQDFKNAQSAQNNSSDLDLKFEELKQFISEQIKESRQVPITIQMQAPQMATPVINEQKPVVQSKPLQEQKNEVKTEVNKSEVKNKAEAFNKFRTPKDK